MWQGDKVILIFCLCLPVMYIGFVILQIIDITVLQYVLYIILCIMTFMVYSHYYYYYCIYHFIFRKKHLIFK